MIHTNVLVVFLKVHRRTYPSQSVAVHLKLKATVTYLTGGVGGMGDEVVLPDVGVAVELRDGVLFILHYHN